MENKKILETKDSLKKDLVEKITLKELEDLYTKKDKTQYIKENMKIVVRIYNNLCYLQNKIIKEIQIYDKENNYFYNGRCSY